ncbi:MAG TPA: hypothetical protein VF211_02745 [Burkholderiales bacterium]
MTSRLRFAVLAAALAGAPLAEAAGARAVPTFESLGLYWTPPADPGAAGCTVRYRASGEREWQEGLPLWYDERDGECRGSLVHLAPGTTYEVRLGISGHAAGAELEARTWREAFPVARTVTVGSRSGLAITEGGSPRGYVLYQAAPGSAIDASGEAVGIRIDASYVIVRGFTVRGAKQHGILVAPGRHDVVIEDNDVSGWGSYRHTPARGWPIGRDEELGIGARCAKAEPAYRMIVQRNRVHDPRYGANSWDWGHPAGPTGIGFYECGGNNVIRYNEVTSDDPQHYYNDAIGGGENGSRKGFPGADSDIYGNVVTGSWDDGIEAEGGGRNVRIWGNYLDRTATGIATSPIAIGPLYIFRNVYNRSRQRFLRAPDEDDRNVFAKSGTWAKLGGGRRYVFHNTLLQAPPEGRGRFPLGAGGAIHGSKRDEPVTNTVSRNNIFQIWKPHWEVLRNTGEGNDFGYDLYNGKLSAPERHGIFGTPRYRPGHGPASGAGGRYQLAADSPGHDAGVRIPNFNDEFRGRAPDIGAAEAGMPPMRFGVAAGRGGYSLTYTTAK